MIGDVSIRKRRGDPGTTYCMRKSVPAEGSARKNGSSNETAFSAYSGLAPLGRGTAAYIHSF